MDFITLKKANDYANKKVEEAQSTIVKRYGARRLLTSSSPLLERIWNAEGFTAAAGVGTTAAFSSFDSVFPWSAIRVCNLVMQNGSIIVTAYENDPTFARDGSNGEVAVEIPKFYQPQRQPGDGYEYWGACELPIAGWDLNPRFVKKDGAELDKIYIGAYNTYYNVADETRVLASDGVTEFTLTAGMHSISGVYPEVSRGRTSFRILAKATGTSCGLYDLPSFDVLATLFTIEFATLNSQSIMQGASSLPYTATHVPVIAETDANRVILANAFAAAYVLGCTIEIGTSLGGRQIANKRRVLTIEEYDASNKAITFDGAAVNTETTHIVYCTGWRSGETDSVAASSGSPVSNSTAKYPCVYRGIENPWGNVWQWVDGINISEYQSWVCSDPIDYVDDVFAFPYKKLAFVNANADGYAKAFGCDERYPWARLTSEIGANTVTYYSDYYYRSTGSRALLVGGNWNNGANAGLWYFNANNAATY